MSILREYIKDLSMEGLLDDVVVREYVRVVLEQQTTPMPLRAVIEKALNDNSSALDYTVENAPRTASEIYARFGSSDVRDTNMEQLAANIEKEVLGVYPDAAFPPVTFNVDGCNVS